MDSDSYPDYFVGMPTTFAGSINAVTIILLGQYGFWQNPNNPYIHLPLLLMVGTAILMVSPLFLPKVKKRKSKFLNMLQAVSILVTYIVGFAMVYTEYLLVNLVLYFVLGFGFGLFNRDKIIAEQEASSVEASA